MHSAVLKRALWSTAFCLFLATPGAADEGCNPNIHSPAEADAVIAACEAYINDSDSTSETVGYAYSYLSNAYFAKEQLDEALTYSDKAIAYNDRNDFAYYMKASVLINQDKLAEAVENYDRAIALNDFFNYVIDRGVAHKTMGNVDLAIDDFRHAIQLDPTLAIAHVNLGRALIEKKEYGPAIAELEAARAQGEQQTEFDQALADAHFRLGNFASAEKYYREWLDGDTGNDPFKAYGGLHYFIAAARSSGEAPAKLQALLPKLPLSGWPRPIVDLYLGNLSPEEAAAAASNDDERCEADFYIGVWKLLHGDQETAYPALQQARETCPHSFVEYEYAALELSRLQQP